MKGGKCMNFEIQNLGASIYWRTRKYGRIQNHALKHMDEWGYNSWGIIRLKTFL